MKTKDGAKQGYPPKQVKDKNRPEYDAVIPKFDGFNVSMCEESFFAGLIAGIMLIVILNNRYL